MRGVTAYRLSRGSGLAYPTAYRLSQVSGVFGRLEVDTLNRLCEFFRVQPGALIEWVPDSPDEAWRVSQAVEPDKEADATPPT